MLPDTTRTALRGMHLPMVEGARHAGGIATGMACGDAWSPLNGRGPSLIVREPLLGCPVRAIAAAAKLLAPERRKDETEERFGRIFQASTA